MTRRDILACLKKRIDNKEAVLAASAGIGLIAKLERMAGVDIIATCLNDYYRMDGFDSSFGYLAYANANTETLRRGKSILKMTKDVPTVAGVGSGDPYLELDELIDELIGMGFSGVLNSPAASAYGIGMEQEVSGTALGLNADLDMITLCREKDIFTMAYAFNENHAKAFADAGADIIVAHCGITGGGLKGAPEESVLDLDEVCEFTQRVCDVVKAENPKSYVLCHGGPLNAFSNVQYCLLHTDCKGFFGSSALDRIPMEEGISDCVRRYKTLKLEAL